MWEHCLKGLESDPLSLWRECDWVAKYRLIEQVRERHEVPLAHPKVAMVDLMYHDVDRNRGLFYKLQRRDQVERTCTDADIATAMTQAPADHPGPAPRGVRPPGQGAPPRLHGGLGAPQAQRPGAAHGALEGPVQVAATTGWSA